MKTIEPGDRLVIRGYSGNVLETDVIYKRSYWTNGEQYVVYERPGEDGKFGVLCTVDARRAEPADDSAIVQFRERLAAALSILGEIGESYCGDLTSKQVKHFHKACAKLAAILDEVDQL